jgi:O-antigen/teichoic acid export membrane protein
MEQLIKKVRQSAFVRHNAILFVGSMSIGLLNYLYYPVIGRLLNPGKFGEVQTLFSLFAQITIFLSVLGLIVVNIVANENDTAKRNRLIVELEKLAFGISIVLLVITIAGGEALKHFFNFGSAIPFTMLALAVLVGTPTAFRMGYLRGQKTFGLVSITGIVAAALDLIFSVVFVLAGWGTSGAIFGLVLANFFAFGFAAFAARRHGFTESFGKHLVRLPDLRLILPELKYALLVLTGSLAITGMYSIDTIAVKHYFDAHTAGLYAGISTVARIIFFLTASIAGVLLPSIRMHHSVRENQQTLQKSFLLLIGIGGAAFIVFAIFPKFVIRVLMGSTYLTYADLLPRLSLAIFTISILNLFILYHMALRRYAIMLIVIIGIVVTLGLLATNHHTLQAVIDGLLFGSFAMLGMLAIWLGVMKLKHT